LWILELVWTQNRVIIMLFPKYVSKTPEFLLLDGRRLVLKNKHIFYKVETIGIHVDSPCTRSRMTCTLYSCIVAPVVPVGCRLNVLHFMEVFG